MVHTKSCPILCQVINQCGRLPVALKAVAAMVAEGLDWRHLLADFKDGFQLEFFKACTHAPANEYAHRNPVLVPHMCTHPLINHNDTTI